MKIVIAGAGAIGGYIGARLARAGADVVLFARGPHLRAMQERGLRVVSPDGDFEVTPAVTGDLATIGPADVVFLGVKAHALTALAPTLGPVLGPDTIVVSTQNGIPWWYFQGVGGELDGLRLERVDPGGVIADAIEPRRVVGSLAYFATDIPEPGVIRHTEGNRISFGEPEWHQVRTRPRHCGSAHRRRLPLPGDAALPSRDLGQAAGQRCLQSDQRADRAARSKSWRGTRTCRGWCATSWSKARRWPARLGIELPISIDQRMAGAEKVGAHKTSMLQDYEAGRPLELEAVVGAVVELGERLGVRDAGDARRLCVREAARRHGGTETRRCLRAERVMNINNRWFQLIASLIAMIMIANLQYAWTLFVQPLQEANGWKLSRHPVRLHAVHPVSDLDPAARRLADRSARPARLHQRGRPALRPRLGRHGLRHVAADALRAVLRGGHGRRVRLQRLDRIGAQVVQGAARARVRHHGGRVRRRHRALHPVHLVDDRLVRLPADVPGDRDAARPGDPRRRAVPASSAAGAGQRRRKAATAAPAQIGKRQFTTLEMLRTPQFYMMYVMFVLDGDRRSARDGERRTDGAVVGLRQDAGLVLHVVVHHADVRRDA